MLPEKDARKKLKVKRKSVDIHTNLSIYMFNTFDEYLEFCMFLLNNTNTVYTFLKKSVLYLYKSKYYLCLHISDKYINAFKTVHLSVIEFATHVNNSDIFERKLKEYGKIIFKTNAIYDCAKHFNNGLG